MSDVKTELDRILGNARKREDMRSVIEDSVTQMADLYVEAEERFDPEKPSQMVDLAMSVSVSMTATLFFRSLHHVRPKDANELEQFVFDWLEATRDAIGQSLSDLEKHKPNKPGGYH